MYSSLTYWHGQASGDLPEGEGTSHGLFRGRRAVPRELETVEGTADSAAANQSRAVPAQLATGNRTIGLVPSTTAEVAPPTTVMEVRHDCVALNELFELLVAMADYSPTKASFREEKGHQPDCVAADEKIY